MESTVIRPRRPWLAAVMSLPGTPLGLIYAGRLRRGLALWSIFFVLLPLVASTITTLRIGRVGFALILLSLLIPMIILPIDAYLAARRRRDAPLRPYQRWWVYLLAFVAFCTANQLLAQVVRSFVFEAFVVPTRGMSPTIRSGDCILVDKFWWGPKNLQRNDIVVFRSPEMNSHPLVMRVVGLPGDQIEIADEQVLLNGEEWPDSHAVFDQDVQKHPELSNYESTTIPSDSFFVLGDNRRFSKDSRVFGPIPLSDLLGKARMIYWSRERRLPDQQDPSRSETQKIRWERIGMRLD